MAYEILSWLTSKVFIDTVLQLGLLVATIGIIVVGIFQALAARAQVKAAEAQVFAANSQAETAKSQLTAGLRSADAATRPVLRIEAAGGGDYKEGDTLKEGKWSMVCDVYNCGLGPALQIEAYCMSDPANTAGWFSEFLGAGDRRTAELTGEGTEITFRYKSAHGSLYETVLSGFPEGLSGSFQLNKLVKDAYPVASMD